MADAGPASRTRAASRTSRESTPTTVLPTRRTARGSRDATPAANRRATGRGINRGTPAPRDGDDALPPVSTKTSKAYGSSGKLTGPVQMDINQVFRRPEMAINTALAQSSARAVGNLPVLDEDAEEAQAAVNQQFLNDVQRAAEGRADEEGLTGQVGGPLDISAWATRVADEQTWFGRVKRSLLQMWITTHEFLFEVGGSFIAWLMSLSTPGRAIFFGHILLLWVFLDVFYGPIHPLIDSTSMRNVRPSTSAFFQVQKHDDSRTRIRLRAVEDQLSSLSSRYLNLFDDKAKPPMSPQINWFEAGQGAVVDPYLTSPSFATKRDLTLTGYVAALFALQKQLPASVPFSRAANEALTHWNDGGLDRWCAPPSRGKLQLTVITARPIAPRELVVEHIAKGASIHVGMAPREVELWVDIEDFDVRFEVNKAILAFDPTLMHLSSPQDGKEIADAQALPPSFVLVSRFLYDIHANQAIQNFNIPLDLDTLGLQSTRFAVRVNSNWGSYDATCLNRLRLHGIDMSGEVEVLEEPL